MRPTGKKVGKAFLAQEPHCARDGELALFGGRAGEEFHAGHYRQDLWVVLQNAPNFRTV